MRTDRWLEILGGMSLQQQQLKSLKVLNEELNADALNLAEKIRSNQGPFNEEELKLAAKMGVKAKELETLAGKALETNQAIKRVTNP